MATVRKKRRKRKSLRGRHSAKAKATPEIHHNPGDTEWSPLTPSELSAWPTDADGDLSIPFPPWLLEGTKPTHEQERHLRELVTQLRVESLRRRYVKPLDDWRAACDLERDSTVPPLAIRELPPPFLNPVFAWRAYAECRHAGLAIPEWVLQYLDKPAREFCSWSMSGRVPSRLPGLADKRKKVDLGDALVSVLEMRPSARQRGPGNIFAEVFPDRDHRRLAGGVYFRVRRNGEPLKVAIPEVATEYKVSTKTVERAWGQYKAELMAGIGEVAPAMSPAQSALVSQKLQSLGSL
jgi:hypothetical protein